MRVLTSVTQEDQSQRRTHENRSRGWGHVLKAGGWGLQPRLREAGKGREMDSSLELPEGPTPADVLILAHKTHFGLLIFRTAR